MTVPKTTSITTSPNPPSAAGFTSGAVGASVEAGVGVSVKVGVADAGSSVADASGVAVSVGVADAIASVAVGVAGVGDGVGDAVARGVRVIVKVGRGVGVPGAVKTMESLAVAVRPFASRYFT